MKVVDSSGWLEFFTDGPLADDYAEHLADLGQILALTAADLSVEHGLAMADALVYATAVLHRSMVITSDSDFEFLPGVTYLEKPRPAP